MNKEFRLALGSSLLAMSSLACEEESVVITYEPHPTIIEVVPEQFLNAELCVDAPDAVQSYVATLVDVTPPSGGRGSRGGAGGGGGADGGGADGGGVGGATGGGGAGGRGANDFALPSSEVVSCLRSIAFGWVVPGRYYRTEILAFDRDKSQIRVLTPGVPLVVDVDGKPVAPRWTTSCERTRAESGLTQRPMDCADLPTGAVAEVEIESALGAVRCGQGEGEVASFLVRRGGIELGRAACGEAVRMHALTPGEFIEVEVLAFSASSSETPILGGVCSATVVPGGALACNPFQSEGSITLDLPALLGAAGLVCDANLTSLDVALDGGVSSLSFDASSCGGNDHFPSLAPGAHALDVTVATRDAEPVTLRCTATVEPGLAATPACAPI